MVKYYVNGYNAVYKINRNSIFVLSYKKSSYVHTSFQGFEHWKQVQYAFNRGYKEINVKYMKLHGIPLN